MVSVQEFGLQRHYAWLIRQRGLSGMPVAANCHLVSDHPETNSYSSSRNRLVQQENGSLQGSLADVGRKGITLLKTNEGT